MKGIYTAPWERTFDRILTPLEHFIHRQTTSGVLLMICAVIALIVANSDLHDSYEHFLHTQISFAFGEKAFSLSVHHWINEALMALFFFIMGLELKRELLVGELSSPRNAALPIIAAAGGMLMPALVYFALNPSGHTANGWGVPMATDIAFAVGAMSLLGARIPKSLLTFLIALAIVDDLGAVAVIAVFYTAELNYYALSMAGFMTAVLISLNLGGIRHPLPYMIVGVFLWLAMLASGVHATIAGIVLAFAIPIRPKFNPNQLLDHIGGLIGKMKESLTGKGGADIIRNSKFRSYANALGDDVLLAQAPAQRLEQQLHLPVAYLVIPIFALANAGVPIDTGSFADSLGNSVTLGVFLGLLVGKLIGIAGFTWVAVRFNISQLPEGLGMGHIVGVALLGGIGFTMSIFIADLGFIDYPQDLLYAKTGILLASLVCGVSGVIWLILYHRKITAEKEPEVTAAQ